MVAILSREGWVNCDQYQTDECQVVIVSKLLTVCAEQPKLLWSSGDYLKTTQRHFHKNPNMVFKEKTGATNFHSKIVDDIVAYLVWPRSLPPWSTFVNSPDMTFPLHITRVFKINQFCFWSNIFINTANIDIKGSSYMSPCAVDIFVYLSYLKAPSLFRWMKP